jgi:hypothetical protein
VHPGSIRRPPQGLVEGGPSPAPGPGVVAYNEQQVLSIIEAFTRIKQLHGGVPAAEVPCSVWQVNTYLLGVANAILVDEPVRRLRRIIVVTNTHVANEVWVGPDSTTRVNFGDKIVAGGTKSFPLSELVRVYAVSNGAGTTISVNQFAT